MAAKETANEAWRGTQHFCYRPTERKKLYDVKWTAQNLPANIQLLVFPFYDKNRLAEYIDGHKTILEFKKFCPNDDMFQKFLFHFFNQIETDDILPNEFYRLDRQYMKFKLDFRQQLSFDETERVWVNVTTFDWATRSLGFDIPILGQEIPVVTNEETFFNIKFEKIHSFTRSPLPDLPASVESIVPSQPDYSFRNHFFTHKLAGNQQPTPYPGPLVESEKLATQFFLRLSAMALSAQLQIHQELLVFAAQLLERSDFQENSFLCDFNIHIWGMLAVCLAKLNVKHALIFSCIHKMKSFVRLESHCYDSAFYQQQAAAAIGWLAREKLFFSYILKKAPRTSIFFCQSIHLHCETTIKHIEDLIMEVHIFKKRNEIISFFKKQTEVTNSISYLRRLLHLVFSKTNMDKQKFGHLFSFFALLDVYEVLLNQVAGGAQVLNSSAVQRTLEMCGILINNSIHNIEYFLDHFNKSTNFQMFLQDMESLHDWLKRDSHCETPIGYADVLFTNTLLIEVFDKLSNPAKEAARKAKDLYEKINHPRFHLLKDFLECEIAGLNRNYQLPTFQISYFSQFDFIKLLHNEPLLKHLIRFGVESIGYFDVDT